MSPLRRIAGLLFVAVAASACGSSDGTAATVDGATVTHEQVVDELRAIRANGAYLEAVRNAPATDWGGLGDIRLSRGDRTSAKRAYAEALRRMHAQLGATRKATP